MSSLYGSNKNTNGSSRAKGDYSSLFSPKESSQRNKGDYGTIFGLDPKPRDKNDLTQSQINSYQDPRREGQHYVAPLAPVPSWESNLEIKTPSKELNKSIRNAPKPKPKTETSRKVGDPYAFIFDKNYAGDKTLSANLDKIGKQSNDNNMLQTGMITGMAQVNRGALGTSDLIGEGVNLAAAKMQSLFTGKKIEPYQGSLGKIIGAGIKNEEAVMADMGARSASKGFTGFITGAISMIPMILPSMVFGSVGGAEKSVSALGKGMAGLTGTGNQAAESKQSEAPYVRRLGSSLASGLVEVLTESPAIEGMSSALAGKFTKNMVAKQAFVEFMGESIAEIMSPIIDEMYKPGAVASAYKDNLMGQLKQIAQAGITGALGGILAIGAGSQISGISDTIDNPTANNIMDLVDKLKTEKNIDIMDVLNTMSDDELMRLNGMEFDPKLQDLDPKARLEPMTMFNAIMKNGGITINTKGEIPTTGYAYSIKSEGRQIPIGDFGPKSLTEYMEMKAEELSVDGMYYGHWNDGDIAYQDVSKVIEDKEVAMETARNTHELAIYDIANEKEIILAERGATTRGDEDGNLKIIHYSPTEGLTEIDPSMQGKSSNAGQEMKTEFYKGKILPGKEMKANFFTNKTDGSEAHRFGKNARYEATIPVSDIYDINKDPQRFRADRDNFQTNLKEWGYKGYYVDGQVRMFDPVAVQQIAKDGSVVDPTANTVEELVNGETAEQANKAPQAKKTQPTTDKEVTVTKSKQTLGSDVITVATYNIGEAVLEVYEKSPYAQGRDSIYNFVVPEDQRKQGIGSALLQKASAKYGKNFAAQVSNENSVKVHYQNGFRPVIFDKVLGKHTPLKVSMEEAVKMFNDTGIESMGMMYTTKWNVAKRPVTSIADDATPYEVVSEPIPMELQTHDGDVNGPKRRSKVVDTVMKSKAIPDEYKEETWKRAEKAMLDYQSIVEKKIVKKVRKKVALDPDQAYLSFMKKRSLDTANDVALGHELIRLAIKDKNINRFNDIVSGYANKSTKVGQALHAMRMLKIMTPEGMLVYAYKSINTETKIEKFDTSLQEIQDILNGKGTTEDKLDLLMDHFKKIMNKGQRLTKKQFITELMEEVKNGTITEEWLKKNLANIFGIKNLSADDMTGILDFMEQSQQAEDGRDTDVLIAKALAIIANNTRTTFTGKFAAMQRISMLLNVPTNVRNFMGNVGMGGLEMMSENLAVPIDIMTSIVTGERTTTTYKSVDLAKGLEGWKRGLFEAIDDYRGGYNTRMDMGQFEITPGKVFDDSVGPAAVRAVAKGMNSANDLTSFLLSAGDRPFYEMHKSIEMSRLARLKKYKGEDSGAALEEAAHNIALDRTFQNRSWLAAKATKIRNELGLFGRINLPFAFTPANIADKIFDYSPLGFTRTLGKNFFVDNFISKDGTFDQREFSLRLSRNISGTAVIFLGLTLARAGIIRGRYPEDDEAKAFMKGAGYEDYVFVFGEGLEYTFDWFQPAAIPLATGANMYMHGLEDEEFKALTWDGLVQSNIETSDVLLAQPLLMGLRRLFQGYGDDAFMQNLLGIVKDSPMQVVPGLSALRGGRKFVDTNVRDVDYSSSLERGVNQLPFFSKNLLEKRDPLGNMMTSSSSFMERLIEPAISPGQFTDTKETMTPTEKMYIDTYKESKDSKIFPRGAPPSVTIDKNIKKLTQEQKNRFIKIQGVYLSEYYDMIGDSIDNMELETRVSILTGLSKDAYDYTVSEIKLIISAE